MGELEEADKFMRTHLAGQAPFPWPRPVTSGTGATAFRLPQLGDNEACPSSSQGPV